MTRDTAKFLEEEKMDVSEKRIRMVEDEHVKRSIELRVNAKSEVNRKAAEFHRGYATALRHILNGYYGEW